MRHSLLVRQIRKHLPPEEAARPEIAAFLDAVDAAYLQSDDDRRMLERSLDLSSAELLQANSEMRGIFTALPDLFLRLDGTGRILDCNAGTDVDLYLAPAELIGKRIQDVPDADVGRQLHEALGRARDEEGMVEVVYRLPVGGEERWYEARIVALLEDQVLAIIRNVTALRRAQDDRRTRLERAERHQVAMVDLAAVQVHAPGDLDGALAAILAAGARGLDVQRATVWIESDERNGFRRAASLGPVADRHRTDPVEPLSWSRHGPYLRELTRTAPLACSAPADDDRLSGLTDTHLDPDQVRATLHVPVWIAGRLAGLLWMEETGRERRWYADELTFARVMADQVAKALLDHERRRQEEHLLRTQKLDSLGVLAGGIAHDFNNTLTGILGNLSLVLDDTDPASEAAEALREAEAATERATSLTRQLLTFATGGKPVKATVRLEPLLRESVAFALRGSNVRPLVTVAPDLPAVELDRGQIGQAIHNLVLNADHAMPTGGTLWVEAETVRKPPARDPGGAALDFVEVRIRDQGVGIAPEHRASVFDPYFTTKRSGTGLGLASTYSILTNHGGEIDLESEVGEGTTFRFRLPASERPVDQVAEPVSREGRSGGRVLVMDDEASIRTVVQRMLERLGYEAVTAHHGDEAVDLYREAREHGRPFDVVVLDLTVPGGMGGEDTLRRLKVLDPEVRAVVCSGYSNDPVMADFRQHGFRGVIVKPFPIQELAGVVGSVLGAEVAAT